MKQLRYCLIYFFLASFASVEGQISIRANVQFLFTDSAERFDQSASINFSILDSLYQSRDFHPIFSRPMVSMYANYLKEMEVQGFDLTKYNYYKIDSLYHAQNAESYAQLDYLAADSYLILLEDITNGILKGERTRGDKVHFPLEHIDHATELQRLSDLPTLNFLKLAEPQIKSYQVTKDYLFRYVSHQEEFGEPIEWTDILELGDRDSMVLKLRQRLSFLGDYVNPRHKHLLIFNSDLALALHDFQQRNLLPPTGILDQRTTVVLNKPVSSLIDELKINLERWRWLPNHFGSYYAFANLPAFEMSLVKNDSLLLRQKMVCGKVSRSTPSFYSTMSYIDINPTWTVPPTILQKDVLPAIKNSSSYLSRTNMKVLDISTGEYINASQINWAKPSNYKFIQGPGLSNSLGVVKFIFPNDYYIFFHDTPHKEHFPLPFRAYSSGCIRLHQPREFAQILLSYNEISYSLTAIDSIIETQKTRRILLQEQATVYVHYITQDYVDGLLYTYPDVYGYNEEQLVEFKKANNSR